MKTLWLFCIVVSIVLSSKHDLYCQSESASKTQFFDAKYTIIKNSLVHNDTAMFKMVKNHPIRISKVDADTIFVMLQQLGDSAVSENKILQKVEKKNEGLYLLISDGSDKLKFTDFDLSPLVIPIKIRPVLNDNPLQFYGDVAIGPYFGYQRGTKSFNLTSQPTQTSTTFCVFGTPTMINLNAANQNDSATNTSSVLGISVGGGILFDINNLQFGLVSGWDWISGSVSQTWIYQGKLWTSFSFAYNISNQ